MKVAALPLGLNSRAPSPSRLRLNWATVSVLARRDVVRFFRQRTRIIGALAQPVLFYFVMGGGYSATFQMPGAEQLNYRAYFYPGVVAMVLLFTAIFSTITLIDDRKEGFLQSVLAGPGSRTAVVLGKCLGSSAIALLQAGLFLLFAPLAEVSFSQVNFGLLLAALSLTSLSLTGLGFALAWWLNSSTAYHAVMSVVLIPMWVLSGAMFPMQGAGPILGALMALNPMRFSVELIRRALYGEAWASQVAAGTVASGLWVLSAFAAVTLGVSAWRVHRRE